MSGTDIDLPQTMEANPAPDAAPVERQPSARELTMARIAANREEVRQREIEQGAIYDQEAREAGLSFPEDEPDEITPAVAAEPVARVVAEPPPAPAQQSPATPAVRIITTVDGHQLAVTDEQAAQLIQLGVMANQALHQYQQPQQTQAPQRQPDPPRSTIDTDALRFAIEKTQYGAPEDAVAAWTSLINGVVSQVPTQQVDPNAIVQRAVLESRHQAQLAADTAFIQQTYPEVFSDPQRQMLANLNVTAIRDRNVRVGRQQSELEIYREAGDAVYDALKLPRPGSEQTPTALQAAQGNVVPIRQDIVERKRAAPRATQAVDLRAPAPAAPRPPSGSEIVDRMRAARGQASMR